MSFISATLQFGFVFFLGTLINFLLTRDTQAFQFHLQKVLEQLQRAPLSITPADARRLHEQYTASDEHTANIISAVEAMAVANRDIKSDDGLYNAAQDPAILHTLLMDLHVTLNINPQYVTPDLLKSAQDAVKTMQNALGQNTAPHLELEEELEKEYAHIKPKVEEGTVTEEEADHLHSLEARAHGHTEKGGLTAHAQSIAAKRERQNSLSDSTNHPTYATSSSSNRSLVALHLSGEESSSAAYTPTSERANNENATRKEQSHKDKEANLQSVMETLAPKIKQEPEKVTTEEANLLHSQQVRAHDGTKKGGVAATAMNLAVKNEGDKKAE
ncbi:hypothetical protein BCR34DRAFT_657954 [Clohesyomyces aquaticus]|uniref:SMP domain-containing protein n=1 Tax=Clohesyomyces aquaticus TaxID=1231657 RepID=A0A1Y1ZF18_9PLEO|nr:hypothetical protein BCR34DRAFT_657954 [Clohesyomyces aquaticus]